MNNLYELCKKCYLKNKEKVNYLICGGITTILNFVVYLIFTRFFNLDEVTSSSFAWLVSIITAYVLNKIIVFESKTKGFKAILKQFTTFICCRIVSGITCDIGTFALMVKVLHINDVISKITTQIMVVIVNYLFSKLLVFRRKDKVEEK